MKYVDSFLELSLYSTLYINPHLVRTVVWITNLDTSRRQCDGNLTVMHINSPSCSIHLKELNTDIPVCNFFYTSVTGIDPVMVETCFPQLDLFTTTITRCTEVRSSLKVLLLSSVSAHVYLYKGSLSLLLRHGPYLLIWWQQKNCLHQRFYVFINI